MKCQREYTRLDYIKNKKDYLRRRKIRLEENKKLLWELLSKSKCVKCGENDPLVLEFDHRDSKSKTREVLLMLKRGCCWETIKKEIDKCEVLCANCHKRKTYKNSWRDKR